MSYDLEIRPKHAHRWQEKRVIAEVERSAARNGARSPRWLIELGPDRSAEIDVVVSLDRGPVVQVSAPSDLEEPAAARLYQFCSELADRLQGSIHDPQGDATYSPHQLGAATSSRWSKEVVLTAAEVLAGGVLLIAGGVWWLVGKPRESPLFAAGVAALALWVLLRCIRRLGERRGQEQ